MDANQLKAETEINLFAGTGGSKYNWWHAHGRPDPNNPDEILAHRIKEEKIRKEKVEDKFWNEVVVPNVKANVSELEMKPGFGTVGFEDVIPQNISDPSDIKIGFR